LIANGAADDGSERIADAAAANRERLAGNIAIERILAAPETRRGVRIRH
jgi:hypothetical protein